ncbi:MAG: hypothetical protein A2V67_16970 [Deltaproteobacteria bacterium RBG_13_61_14]|nr:MAG: hypothetical protein A2V67_16970 [Deltaproteobacteria bacterium RBG_13_61_14]
MNPSPDHGVEQAHGSQPGRGHAIILAGILLFALILKLLHLGIVHNYPLLEPRGDLDPKYYFDFALRVMHGDLLAGPDVFFISPFYIYFLAAVFGLIGSRVVMAYVVQTLLGTLAIALIYLAGRRAFGPRAGLFAAALMALDGILTFYEVTLLPEAVTPVLTALLLWLLVRAQTRPTVPAWLLAGISLGLLGLDRPNALLFAPIAALFALFALRPLRLASLRPVAALALGAALFILPVTLRNYVIGQDLVLISSHGGMNFYIGNGPGAIGTYQSPPGVAASITGQMRDTRRIAEAAAGRALKPSEVSDYYYRLAWNFLRAHPLWWINLNLLKIIYLVNGAEVGLNLSYAFFQEEVSWPLKVLFAGFGVIFPLGILGLGLARKRAAPIAILAAFLGVYAVSVVIFFVADRYRIPLHLPLLLFAGFALDRWLTLVQHRAWVTAAVLLAAGLALGWLANLDQGLEQGKDLMRTDLILYDIENYHFDQARAEIAKLSSLGQESAAIQLKLGQAFMIRNQFTNALEHLETAARLDPKLAETHQMAALIWIQKMDYAQALPHLQAWFWLKPEDIQAGVSLATVYSKLGQPQQAIEVLRGLIHTLPDEASLHYFLGVLSNTHGDRGEAIRELERAVALSPDTPEYRATLEKLRASSPK